VNELTFQGGGQQGEQRGYDEPPANDDLDGEIPF
jgi:hypothetical protein